MSGLRMSTAEADGRKDAFFDAESEAGETEALKWEGKDEDNGVGSDRRGVGPEALLYAVIEQAQADVKLLRDRGIIVDGDCVAEWPRDAKGEPLVLSHEYDGTRSVNELLDFLRGDSYGMTWLLEYLGGKLVDPAKALAVLGLKKDRKLTLADEKRRVA